MEESWHDQTDRGLLVQCRHLTRTVPNAKTGKPKKILDDVSVDFHPGEVTAIIGPSGCGKSTLLKAICGIDQADAPVLGTESGVFFNGIDYYKNIEKLSKRIAYLPQYDADWLHDDLTVEQELRYVQKLRTIQVSAEDTGKIRSIVEELAAQNVLEQRVSTIGNLSGGEKKRVAIVGAELANPALVLLDEPTAPLDPGTSAAFVQSLVADAKRDNLTTIMVTHDPLALQGFGESDSCRIVLLGRKDGRDGRLIFSGTAHEFMSELKRRYQTNDVGTALQKLFKGFANGENFDFPSTEDGSAPVAWEDSSDLMQIKPPSAFKQFRILLSRELALLRGNFAQLAILLAVPCLIGLMMKLVVKDPVQLYKSGPYEKLLATMFILAVGSFFVGIFDSINSFSARVRIKTEELHGMKPGAHVMAVATVMTLLCLVQTAILTLSFNAAVGVPSQDPLYGGMFDMFQTLFLCMLSASMLGMLCSMLIRSTTYVAPLVIVVEILFSEVFLRMDGAMNAIGKLTSLRWTMNALAAITHMNDISRWDVRPERMATKIVLFESWTSLTLISIGILVLCYLVMKMKRQLLFHPNFLGVRELKMTMGFVKHVVTSRLFIIVVGAILAAFLVSQNVLKTITSDIGKQTGSVFSSASEAMSDVPDLAGEWIGDGMWSREMNDKEYQAYKKSIDEQNTQDKLAELSSRVKSDPEVRKQLMQDPELRKAIIEDPEIRKELVSDPQLREELLSDPSIREQLIMELQPDMAKVPDGSGSTGSDKAGKQQDGSKKSDKDKDSSKSLFGIDFGNILPGD